MQQAEAKPEMLIKLARMRMPFGRYKGTLLIDLPEPYVVWFHQQGYPRGSIGELLRALYEIKANGLEFLLDPLRDGGPSAAGRTGKEWNG